VVLEAPAIQLEPSPDLMDDHPEFRREKISFTFAELEHSKPRAHERDQLEEARALDHVRQEMYPQMARHRGFTYSGGLYCNIIERRAVIDDDGDEIELLYEKKHEGIFLGKVPIMLKSKFCHLGPRARDPDEDDSDDDEEVSDLMTEDDLTHLGECPFDQGGYFVIRGNEKVLVAQERVNNNAVYVFDSGGKIGSEIRSIEYGSKKPTATLYCRLQAPRKGVAISGQVVHITIPKVRDPIPMGIVFRALGFISDKQIVEHIVYDFSDAAMLEALRPSLEEAAPIQSQQVALDYIGKRCNTVGANRAARAKYAHDLLQKEMLPHVGTTENLEVRKAFFLGYMINKLLATYMSRREYDNRDHYGNKRMDMAGVLMTNIFRQLFGTCVCVYMHMHMHIYIYMCKCVCVSCVRILDCFLTVSIRLFTGPTHHHSQINQNHPADADEATGHAA
jgi:DNA-directed RNA polymerase II subunit RPB2